MKLTDIEISEILESINCRMDVIESSNIPDNIAKDKIKKLCDLWNKVYQML
jgi:hypothetical protein